jgi:hypothetical protein
VDVCTSTEIFVIDVAFEVLDGFSKINVPLGRRQNRRQRFMVPAFVQAFFSVVLTGLTWRIRYACVAMGWRLRQMIGVCRSLEIGQRELCRLL